MANLIQIKRSLTTANATSLANGELAYTANGDVLWIGSNGGVVAIGGGRTPGTLTANQALVANSTSGIDKVIVANLVTTSVTANGVVSPGAGYYLAADSGGNTYWAAPGTLAINTAAQYTWTNTHAFNANVASSSTTTGTIVITGGLGVSGRINTLDFAAGNTTVYTSVNSTVIQTGSLLATDTVNSAILSVGNWVVANNGGVWTSGRVNGAIVSVGTSFVANTTRVVIGSTTGFQANGSIGTAGQVLTSDGTTVYWTSPTTGDITAVTAGSGLTGGGSSGDVTLDVGAGNGIAVNADDIAVVAGTDGGLVSNSTGVFVNAGSGLLTNSTGLHVGSGNGISTAADAVYVSGGSTLTVNSTGVHVNTANLSIATSQLTGDVALGTNTSGNYVATITAGNGISGSSSSEGGTPTIAVVAGTDGGLVSNSTGVFVSAGSGLVSNSTGLHVGAANGISVGTDTVGLTTGSTLTVNSTGAHVNTNLSITSLDLAGNLLVNGNTTIGNGSGDYLVINAGIGDNIMPFANATYSIGNNLMRFNEIHTVNVHSVSGYFDGDVQISGNLSILGDVLTVNVATLSIEDSLIQLAKNNTTSDLLDIGFYGNYNGDGGAHEHTGIFRDATDGIYKLFQGLSEGPTTTVNTAAAGYSLATLQTYLQSSALTSNATAVTLTANSTVAVNITANSLSLSTPLAVSSGGLGLSSITAGAILVGNGSGTATVLSAATDGYVLQSNGTSVVYGTLDGGTF